MSLPALRRLAASVLAAAVLAGLGVHSAQAQIPREPGGKTRAARQAAQKPAEIKYPDATRSERSAKVSRKAASKLQKALDLQRDDKFAEARAEAEAVLAMADATPYDRAVAAQLAAHSAYQSDDYASAKRFLQQALELDALDNNTHYDSMLMLAQLQMEDDAYAESLATLDRFLSETRTQKPEHLALKGNLLYRLERYQDAVKLLEQAAAALPERNDVQQLLMASYFELERPAEAAQIAERIAARNPDDKRAQLNLAAAYLQGDMLDKAAAVLERLRAAGKFSEHRDYEQLYATYLNMDGKEREAIAVINEGLDKGILKPEFKVYLALAQAYYFSDQPGPAIEAYRKAAPLDDDGETWLNLARLLWQEDRIPEAKQAAQQALAKGLKKPEDARKILALPGGK
ncbi:tetratricopeptide repeat protein [Vulcaniibacterium gelatinicum]|uniref:tetratricopeptide repeat protein n=1 Tax=Vulcaniibacterium gelatinicum TaxID=2598725 RepID=UPI0011CCC637|nr:tetratricopeptide repeat protein [Vulcaniibacterium gelatinicum]